MKVSSSIKPCLIVVIQDLDNENISLPVPSRIAHPGFYSWIERRLTIGVDQPEYLLPLERYSDVLRSHKDLKGKLHRHNARNPWQETISNRISGSATLEVDLPLLSGPRLIWDRRTVHHPSASWHIVPSTLILKIVRRPVYRPPDTW